MLITVKIDVPDDVTISRDDLQTILAEVPYAPDKAMSAPLKPGRKPMDEYNSGRFKGIKTKWKVDS